MSNFSSLPGNQARPSDRAAIEQALAAAVLINSKFKSYDVSSHKVACADTYFSLIDKLLAAKQALADELAKIPDDDFCVYSFKADGTTDLVLVSSTKRASAWQMTRFDGQGEPWSDTTYDTKMQGLKEFLSECILTTVHDQDGALMPPEPVPGSQDNASAEAPQEPDQPVG